MKTSQGFSWDRKGTGKEVKIYTGKQKKYGSEEINNYWQKV